MHCGGVLVFQMPIGKGWRYTTIIEWYATLLSILNIFRLVCLVVTNLFMGVVLSIVLNMDLVDTRTTSHRY